MFTLKTHKATTFSVRGNVSIPLVLLINKVDITFKFCFVTHWMTHGKRQKHPQSLAVLLGKLNVAFFSGRQHIQPE